MNAKIVMRGPASDRRNFGGWPRRRRPWPPRVGTCPEGGAQEPDDHQHGQADALEVVFLQGRETDAERGDDEEESADGKTRWMHRDPPMSDPCILISPAKVVNEQASKRLGERIERCKKILATA
jgi:hypothetical protein